jgi:hypothetical protein
MSVITPLQIERSAWRRLQVHLLRAYEQYLQSDKVLSGTIARLRTAVHKMKYCTSRFAAVAIVYIDDTKKDLNFTKLCKWLKM